MLFSVGVTYLAQRENLAAAGAQQKTKVSLTAEALSRCRECLGETPNEHVHGDLDCHKHCSREFNKPIIPSCRYMQFPFWLAMELDSHFRGCRLLG